MKKLLPILLVLCTVAFAQKSKLIISVSGELEIDMADVLMDGISYGLKNNDKYQILINDRQFKETLKKEWQKGNIPDDRIIALAQRAGADYLCFTKIKSVKGLKGKQVTASVYDLATMSYTDQMGMETIESDFSNLKHLTKIILDVVDDMLGTSNRASRDEPERPAQKSGNVSGNTFTDTRDGKKYKITKIGGQTWMAENLNYNASGSECYNNQESNCKIYGRLYNWNTARSACPSGWHLPSRAEWEVLTNFVNPSCFADCSVYLVSCCTGVGTKLKATSGWNNNGNGIDAYGFSALPYNDDKRSGGYWWSSSEGHDGLAPYLGMSCYNDKTEFSYFRSDQFISVRCIQN